MMANDPNSTNNPNAGTNPTNMTSSRDADIQNILNAYNKLSTDDRIQFNAIIAQPNLGSQPSQIVVDFAWRAIISVFVAVFVLSALAIIASIWIAPFAGAPGKPETLITIFSTTVGFLAGVLTPSPVGQPNRSKTG